MVFSSLLFLFRFLPIVLLLYYIAPKKYRNFVLLITSLVFYAWGEPVFILLMLLSIAVSYTGGILVDRFRRKGKERAAKITLIVSVAIGLGFLCFFKYTNLLLDTVNSIFGSDIGLLKLALPIGISFYTFQTISYIIDVYRGSAKVQTNFISYGAYVTMFPQLIAGPIVQYKTIDEQLRSREEDITQFADGVNRFVIGLGKKVLLANSAGELWKYIRVMDARQIPVVMAWLGIAAFTFNIYFDFSGYSDMAIGLGKMFGFHFLENFDYPYLSDSITVFWRRWHISLGTWFREYVYIPLGGNRVSAWKHVRNIFIVWMLTGIWHGDQWNFLIWGIYYGILLLIEKFFLKDRLEKLPGAVRHIYCMFLVMIGWAIFEVCNISCGARFFLSLFGLAGNTFAGGETLYLLYNYALLFVFMILGASKLPVTLAGKLLHKVEDYDLVCILLRGVFYTAVLVLSCAYLVDASYNPFLYFRF